jgi:hypothetical protein
MDAGSAANCAMTGAAGGRGGGAGAGATGDGGGGGTATFFLQPTANTVKMMAAHKVRNFRERNMNVSSSGFLRYWP